MVVCARKDAFVGKNGFEHIDLGFVGAPAYPGHFRWIAFFCYVVSGRGVR